MDKELRNKLRIVVTQCRKLLEESVSQILQGRYGIHPDGRIEEESHLGHLSAEERTYRDQAAVHLLHIVASGQSPKQALEQLVREVAFTHLNRLAAFKLMEGRKLIREAVSRGPKSNGYKFYLVDSPEDYKLDTSGQQEIAYRHFLLWQAQQFSGEISVLFSPNDLANRLFPPQRVLDQVIDLINAEDMASVWARGDGEQEIGDETIGWIYQFFTPDEMRKKARSESRSPRNSHELAFRNQFFTPRYVVEFLTDNTLGRIWYEMRKGNTNLKDQCRYMVRRPGEIFLADRQLPPKHTTEGQDGLSQEELLKLPVYIPHRPKKDPRDLKILDPASGSGHFLLYCFDLLLVIYEEAYNDPDLGPVLQRDYPTLADLKLALPGLILARNLYGIDIDLRASQIAALALWLRCQRAFQDMGIKKDRPKITRSNFVCAEPMPGESQMLTEFVGQLEPKLLGQLVEVVFDKMKLAGDAGSLLKIEDELRDSVAQAKRQWLAGPVQTQGLLFDNIKSVVAQQRFDFSGITDAQFFEQAEGKVVEALGAYAEKAQNGQQLLRRLFTEDAVRGFAFVDLCNSRFDVILMNPPFGELNARAKNYVVTEYEHTSGDILAAFVERALQLCQANGFVGAITNRNCFYLTSMTGYRKEVLQQLVQFEALLDLGEGVLDAMVEPAAYVMRNARQTDGQAPFIRLLVEADKGTAALDEVAAINAGQITHRTYYSNPADFSRLSSAPFCYWVPKSVIVALSKLPPIEGHTARINVGLQTGSDWRFLRLVWETDPRTISPAPRRRNEQDSIRSICLDELTHGKRWAFFSKTDVASPWYSPITLLVDWENNGRDIRNFTDDKGRQRSAIRNEGFYFRPGFSYMLRSTRIVPYVIPPGVIPTAGRSQVYPEAQKEIEVLGTCASRLGSAVGRFGGEMFARPKFQASMVQAIPAVPMALATVSQLEVTINRELENKRRQLSRFEPWQEFALPALLDEGQIGSDAWQLDTFIGDELEEAVARDAGLSQADLITVCRDLQEAIALRTGKGSAREDETSDDEDEEDESISLIDSSPRSLRAGFVSYCLGVIFGRWDVRMATDRTLVPKPQQVLDPIPPCPPGTLVSSDGYPAQSGMIVSEEWLRARVDAFYLPEPSAIRIPTIPDTDYPLKVEWDGVLVDDTDHPNDIVRRAKDVFSMVWRDGADVIEQQTCDLLGVKELREYFRRSGTGGFWLDHIGQYSKSRRKAPIYWLLQSKNRGFAIWLYCHRLNKDILFKALLNYAEPKVRLEEDRLKALLNQKASAGMTGRAAKQLEKDVDKQQAFVSELHDFRDKLKRAADLNLVPDLNDGVVLNIAPLHELVPWREAKQYWDELTAGKYEWSSIAKQLREKGLVQ